MDYLRNEEIAAKPGVPPRFLGTKLLGWWRLGIGFRIMVVVVVVVRMRVRMRIHVGKSNRLERIVGVEEN